MSLNVTSESLYILGARTEVWIPAKESRPWQDSPVMILVHQLTGRVLRRAPQMLGLAIAVIIEIIALTAATTMARLALREEIQTAEFIRDGINILQNFDSTKSNK